MVKKLARLIFGSVNIRITGNSIERFFNICIKNQIKLYNINRQDEVCVYASLSIKDFRRLLKFMGRSGCKVHIIKRCGLPFFIYRTRKRYGLWLGAFTAVVLYLLLTGCIWVIDIDISGDISASELRKNLTNAGAYTGVPIYKVDETHITQTVLSQMRDKLDYLSVSRIGNRLIVQAVFDGERPKIEDDKAITGIVANYNGFITKMNVKSGYPLVKIGDSVAKGDLLVSAVTPPRTEQGTGYIGKSKASITAQTLRTETSIKPLTNYEKQYTGKKKTLISVVICGFRINLYLGTGISGVGWEKSVSEHDVHIGEGTYFPIKIIKQDYKQYTLTKIKDSSKKVEQEMLENAKIRINSAMNNGQIENLVYNSEQKNGALILTVSAHCSEDIAEEISQEGITIPENETE